MQNAMENIKSKQGSLYQKYKKTNSLFKKVLIKSWWTLLFMFICFIFYNRALCYKQEEQRKLTNKLTAIEAATKLELVKQEDLKLQIVSQEDPDFIELTLIRRLGLIPKGTTKIHFVFVP